MKANYKEFLRKLNLTVGELAALRGVSRQYATRDMQSFIGNPGELKKFAQVLQLIDTERSRKCLEALGLTETTASSCFDAWEIYIKLQQLQKIEALMKP